jgi:hypothetical protein
MRRGVEARAAGLLAVALTVAAAAAEPPPDQGFLEFLGMLVESDDGFVDPLDLTEVELLEGDVTEPAAENEDDDEDD